MKNRFNKLQNILPLEQQSTYPANYVICISSSLGDIDFFYAMSQAAPLSRICLYRGF